MTTFALHLLPWCTNQFQDHAPHSPMHKMTLFLFQMFDWYFSLGTHYFCTTSNYPINETTNLVQIVQWKELAIAVQQFRMRVQTHTSYICIYVCVYTYTHIYTCIYVPYPHFLRQYALFKPWKIGENLSPALSKKQLDLQHFLSAVQSENMRKRALGADKGRQVLVCRETSKNHLKKEKISLLLISLQPLHWFL